MKRNEHGFGAIETLLMVIIISVIGFAGWYVYHAKKNTNDTLKNTSQAVGAPNSTQKAKPIAAVDPTKDWTVYSDVKGQFSLKYPIKWVRAVHPELCSEGLLLLGANENTVGACASEGFGQIGVSSNSGDFRSDNELAAGYVNIDKQKSTVAGVVGSRQTGTASSQDKELFVGGLPDGTKVVKYIFYTNGNTYIATYNQKSGYPDVLSDFDLMVTKTLKFSN